MSESDTRVRIDKWLWAARFYKTRSLAADAVDSGKVKLNGERVKPAKLLKPGDMLSIRNGQSSWEVTVLALSERRGSATVASTLYRESDILSLHVTMIPGNENLIGAPELSMMKHDAILVNVARGALLDEKALYEHMQSHASFLLGIDAWWTEPFLHGHFRMEYPFLELPNVLGSPHNSAVVPHVLVNAAQGAAANVKHFLKGEQVMGMARREDYL